MLLPVLECSLKLEATSRLVYSEPVRLVILELSLIDISIGLRENTWSIDCISVVSITWAGTMTSSLEKVAYL